MAHRSCLQPSEPLPHKTGAAPSERTLPPFWLSSRRIGVRRSEVVSASRWRLAIASAATGREHLSSSRQTRDLARTTSTDTFGQARGVSRHTAGATDSAARDPKPPSMTRNVSAPSPRLPPQNEASARFRLGPMRLRAKGAGLGFERARGWRPQPLRVVQKAVAGSPCRGKGAGQPT